MARFDWTARDRSGRSINGTLDATTKEEVVSRLQSQGLNVLNVESVGSTRSETVDFAARLDAHSAGAVDYSARLQPQSARRRPGLAILVALIFGGVGAAILWVAGRPVQLVPTIVAAVFLLLSVVTLVMVGIGLMMPGHAAAAAAAITRRAEESRRHR